MTAHSLTIANPAYPGGADLLAQVFYADPAGQVDAVPVHNRIIHPGVVAILNLRPGNYLVLQVAPQGRPAAAAAGES